MSVLVHIKNVHGSDTRKANTSVHGVHLLLCISKRWHRAHTNRYMVSHTLSLTHCLSRALSRSLPLSLLRALMRSLSRSLSLARAGVRARLPYTTGRRIAIKSVHRTIIPLSPEMLPDGANAKIR